MLARFADEPREERIIVALDCERRLAQEVAEKLRGRARWVKIGMTFFYREGPDIVADLKKLGFKVFLDLKFFDIPHQVYGAAYSSVASGADMITVHALGGAEMMHQACLGSKEAAGDFGMEGVASLGITVLTSMDSATLAESGIARSTEEQVLSLAQQAQASGLSGIVCSPLEAALMREVLGDEAYIVTPGVRPAGSEADDQHRVATPADAFDRGASHIVIGRPITASPDPLEAFEAIAASL